MGMLQKENYNIKRSLVGMLQKGEVSLETDILPALRPSNSSFSSKSQFFNILSWLGVKYARSARNKVLCLDS